MQMASGLVLVSTVVTPPSFSYGIGFPIEIHRLIHGWIFKAVMFVFRRVVFLC